MAWKLRVAFTGSCRSLLTPFPSASSAACFLYSHERHSGKFSFVKDAALKSYLNFAGDGIIRVFIGLEASEDLCADIDQALKEGE
jgi:hypothetical protein